MKPISFEKEVEKVIEDTIDTSMFNVFVIKWTDRSDLQIDVNIIHNKQTHNYQINLPYRIMMDVDSTVNLIQRELVNLVRNLFVSVLIKVKP